MATKYGIDPDAFENPAQRAMEAMERQERIFRALGDDPAKRALEAFGHQEQLRALGIDPTRTALEQQARRRAFDPFMQAIEQQERLRSLGISSARQALEQQERWRALGVDTNRQAIEQQERLRSLGINTARQALEQQERSRALGVDPIGQVIEQQERLRALGIDPIQRAIERQEQFFRALGDHPGQRTIEAIERQDRFLRAMDGNVAQRAIESIEQFDLSIRNLFAHMAQLDSPAEPTAASEGPDAKKPGIAVRAVIIPEKAIAEGTLVQSTSLAWASIVRTLGNDWQQAFQISPDVWEEIIAGAFKEARYDKVILTPRSGDHGRDVIATKYGVGSVKIIGSVKAYRPNRLVRYDDIRALLGVLSGERDASKGIIATTSGFPPRILEDPFIAPFLPTRLELMDGEALRKWLRQLVEAKSN